MIVIRVTEAELGFEGGRVGECPVFSQEFTEEADVTDVYVRVSSHGQKEKGDLVRQEGRVLENCVRRGKCVEFVFVDVVFGISDDRVKSRRLIRLEAEGKRNRISDCSASELCHVSGCVNGSLAFADRGIKFSFLATVSFAGSYV